MNISQFAKRTERLITDNSPAILTALGVTGVVTTAYLTGKASFEAAKVLSDEQYHINIRRTAGEEKYELTRKDKFKLLWKLYIPAVTAGTLSCAAIIGANRIGTRRAAAVATAWSLSERAYTEYRDKVVEKLGEKEEKEIREELAHERVQRDLAAYDVDQISGPHEGKVLCHDEYSGRFFWSTIETVRKAVNDVNREININDHATVSDFYDTIGLAHTSLSDEMGWNTSELLTIEWTTVPTPDGGPAAHSFEFTTRPVMRPWNSNAFR